MFKRLKNSRLRLIRNSAYAIVLVTPFWAYTDDINASSTSSGPKQFFLKEGPLAILPFSKNYFSFVWSVKKYFFENNSKKITNLVKKKNNRVTKV